MAKVDTLQDNFTGGTLDTDKWRFYGSDRTETPSYYNMGVRKIKLELEGAADSLAGMGYLASQNTFDFSSSMVFAKDTTPDSSQYWYELALGTADFSVYIYMGIYNKECYSGYWDDVAQDYVGGVYRSDTATGWSKKKYPFMALKEEDGMIYSGISRDGQRWEFEEEFATSLVGDVSALHFYWGGYCYSSTPKTLHLSGVNVPGTPLLLEKYPTPSFLRAVV
jgi:hypothetical protein